MNILGICSIALDTISSVDHLPIVDSFCTVLETKKLQGGSGTNVLVQAQKLGAHTAVITKIASDPDSDQIMKNLKNYGIDSRGVYREIGNYKAPHCLIYVDSNGEKTLILDKPSDLPPFTEDQINLDLIDSTEVVYLDFNPAPLTPKIAELAKSKNKKVVMNVQDNMTTIHDRGLNDDQLLGCLKFLDVFAPCQEGIKELSGEDDVDKQINFIRKYYKGLIILTLGINGLVAVDETNKRYVLPSYKVTPVDTTGAGDSFIGSFMYAYLTQNMDLVSALKFSTACAALTCTQYGAQASPTLSEVNEFMSNNKLKGVD
ncbi:MAG TPA: hypothetical protein DDW71_04110 [Lactobacillus sp.]|nr:hypothetical protein [Lactobacillus sp.]